MRASPSDMGSRPATGGERLVQRAIAGEAIQSVASGSAKGQVACPPALLTIISILAMIVSSAGGHATWPLALPLATLWIASPAIARWTSRSPPVAGRLPMSDGDARILRLTARRTWRFFETFVTAADHMLPPDNFQEDPAPVLAHRTSPTNLGLYLLSTASARDFGWTGTIEAVDPLQSALSAISELPRFPGPCFNWYHTSGL